MKKALALTVLALAVAFAAPAFSQGPQQAVPSTSVNYTGCPAPSVTSTVLPGKFSALSATLTNPADVAFLASIQTLINASLAAWFSANPQWQVNITVTTSRVITSKGFERLQFNVVANQELGGSGSSCPTS